MIRQIPSIFLPLATILLLSACTTNVGTGTLGSSATDTPAADGSSKGDSAAASETSTMEDNTVITNLDAPWSIAFLDSATLISERNTARIHEVAHDGRIREVGVIDGVQSGGEGGLLGIATFEKSLYAYYTGAEGNRVERFPLDGEPGALALGQGEMIIDSIPKSGFHNGGRIAFGPDGMLYVTTGDAGQPDNAQDLNSTGGKILRLTPDGGNPEDNPFPNSAVYSYGHRNPQGIAWDENGTMYSTEFGQNSWDELNIVEPGENYGWPIVEGIANREGYVDPVQQWKPSEASPSGMTIAGESIFIANLRGERLRKIPLNDPGTSSELLSGEHGRLRDVVTAPDGTLRILTNNTDGRGTPSDTDDRMLSLTPDGKGKG